MSAPSTTVPPACEYAFKDADEYVHSKTEGWNTEIIVRLSLSSNTPTLNFPKLTVQPTQNTILQSLIRETSSRNNVPPYKYAVNSTIIQHVAPTASSSSLKPAAPPSSVSDFVTKKEEDALDEKGSVAEAAQTSAAQSSGRRGMHSATGAYWNNERDGMWNFKYEAIENRGLDVVVSIIWIAI
ncbi:MAG: hypothetical protein M1836_001621 [Candelina mexicana]|nr:MAG: hypothetical protein M1836_001621 [Candelina mexicana]